MNKRIDWATVPTSGLLVPVPCELGKPGDREFDGFVADVRAGRIRPIAGGSRDHDRIALRVNNGAQSGSGTVTNYFVVGNVAFMAKDHYLVGINPAAADADTLRSIWDHATNGSTFTTIHDEAADEYNDTDNDLLLTALVPSRRNTADLDVRVPAGDLIRHREIWTGTVTDGHVAVVLSGIAV